VKVDPATGTRVMVEGSTGGAGVTATGIAAADAGHPVPLNATLIYLARRGPRAGQVLAYDEVTVGGLGLASISLNRTVVRPPETSTSTSTPTPSISTPSPAPSPTTPTPSTPTPSTPTPPTPSPAPSSLPAPSGTIVRPRRRRALRRSPGSRGT
jgi:hypothetical protein